MSEEIVAVLDDVARAIYAISNDRDGLVNTPVVAEAINQAGINIASAVGAGLSEIAEAIRERGRA